MQVYNDEHLFHTGVKGMKWGHHKAKIQNNKYKRIIMDKNEPTKLCETRISSVGKFLGKIIPGLKKQQDKFKDYELLDEKGNKVGGISTFAINKNTCNIPWLDVSTKYRGSGHAQSAIRQVVKDCKKQGFKEVTLEVPTHSPDARHIYEKNGFVAGKQITDSSDVWGGLTEMKLKL